MRILSNAPDPRFGGPLKRSLSVARRLREQNIETKFLVPTGDDSFVNRADAEGFDNFRIDQPRIRSPEQIRENIRFVFGFPRYVRRVKRIIERENIDIVHVNGPLNYGTALATARSDASLVWHFNDTLTPTPLKQVSATLATRWANKKVVAAEAVGEYFFGSNADTTTIYAPVNLDQFDPNCIESNKSELRDDFQISDTSQIIGAVGNINPAKGHRYLINAFSQSEIEGHLVIVGRKLDSQQAYYEKLKNKVRELGIESKVTFAGWREDIPELLSLFDVFVLSSVTEACPIVVLEAMAMKTPIIATDVGGVRELIPDDDHGWVVPPESPDRLSQAIDSALSSEGERATRVANARERVKQIFSLEACVKNHVAVYESLITDSI